MKKLFVISMIVMAAVGLQAANTNYWPHNTNMAPFNLGSTFGINAYVVGASADAVAGSIAIGDGNGIAYVLDATNAVQIGSGVNTNSNTIRYRSTQIYPVIPSVTLATNFTFLSATATTGKVWIANGIVTNVVRSGQ
ncbi:MAG TPA: hypothetical protein PLZ55_06825 [bacterium]|nr:hypothetical protein [bacterium]